MRALTFTFSFFIALGCGGSGGGSDTTGSGGTATGGSDGGPSSQLTDAEITEYCDDFCNVDPACADIAANEAAGRAECNEMCPQAVNAMNGAMIPEFLPGLLSCVTSTACDALPAKSEENSEKVDLVEYCMTNQPCAAEYDTSPTGGIMAKVLEVAKRCYTPEQVAMIENGMKESADPDDGMTAIFGCLSADINNAIDQCFAEVECEDLDFDKVMQECFKPVMDIFAPGESEKQEEDLPDLDTGGGGDDASEPSDG